jgi:putative transposase
MRAKIVLDMDAGTNNDQIAWKMQINRETVRYWRATWLMMVSKLEGAEAESKDDKAVAQLIEAGLTDKPRAGTPATFTAEQICQILAVGCENPAESNRSISHWTPRELADEVIKRKIVESISVRSVGRFLKSGGFETTPLRAMAQRLAT